VKKILLPIAVALAFTSCASAATQVAPAIGLHVEVGSRLSAGPEGRLLEKSPAHRLVLCGAQAHGWKQMEAIRAARTITVEGSATVSTIPSFEGYGNSERPPKLSLQA